jgi:hypothetical protein
MSVFNHLDNKEAITLMKLYDPNDEFALNREQEKVLKNFLKFTHSEKLLKFKIATSIGIDINLNSWVYIEDLMSMTDSNIKIDVNAILYNMEFDSATFSLSSKDPVIKAFYDALRHADVDVVYEFSDVIKNSDEFKKFVDGIRNTADNHNKSLKEMKKAMKLKGTFKQFMYFLVELY